MKARKLGFALLAFALKPLEMGKGLSRKAGKLGDPSTEIGDAKVRVQLDKILELPIDDPFE